MWQLNFPPSYFELSLSMLSQLEEIMTSNIVTQRGPNLSPFVWFNYQGGLFFAKTMRDRKYVTMMDPFQIKYGNLISGVLSVALLISDIIWVTGTLIGLGKWHWCQFSLKSHFAVMQFVFPTIIYLLYCNKHTFSVNSLDLKHMMKPTCNLIPTSQHTWYRIIMTLPF